MSGTLLKLIFILGADEDPNISRLMSFRTSGFRSRTMHSVSVVAVTVINQEFRHVTKALGQWNYG